MTLIDMGKIPFTAYWKEANLFADDIVCAVGTEYMQKIAEAEHRFICDLLNGLQQVDVVDAVPIVRCNDCIHAVPLDRNCELNTSAYMHCNLWRGEETKNVWHKYKKYYKDYSLVDRDDFCSSGERMKNEAD